jgi:alpha-beta hydrolase superfamily lysophospholipase
MRALEKVLLVSILLAGCKTTESKLQSTEGMTPSAAQLWEKHVQYETGGKKIQPDCMPRFYPASPAVERRGMVMFFHGFTACPQQYFAISEMLAAKGYDVYLPLMPGQGREPLDGPKGDNDNYKELPSTQHKGGNFPHEYQDGDDENDRLQYFVKSMNEIAAATPGERIIVGLSGGGGLATGAAAEGQGLWARALLYAPYYKNPGASGWSSALLDQIMPGFVNDWGPECRENRRSQVGRAGLCMLTIGAVRAMTNYGVNAAKRITQIKIPVQFVGVAADPTADNSEIYRTFQKITDHAKFCIYPKGVPHSIINPKSDAPKITDPYWVPAMQQDSVSFITEAKWFPESEEKATSADHNLPICRH